ncbi:MAG: EamA family transporter [Bacteroidetes bacterium]|nr:EamA family transporter [Bacteroidota bacterium]
MVYLLIVSLIWAFSFGLIKTNLTSLDSNFVSFVRLGISLLAFLPFLRIKKLLRIETLKLIGIGAIQYGLMYTFYIASYQHLQSFEIALFTILTPVYIIVIHDLIERRINYIFLFTALSAVIGGGIVMYRSLISEELLTGFLLVQLSNICFASGQIFYSKIKKKLPEKSDHSLFGLLYLGAVLVSFTASLFTTNYSTINLNSEQLYTLIYLGAIASGLSFFLWNVGATKVNEGALAAFNNLKIPLAVSVSILVFGEHGDLIRLGIGLLIILAALYINENVYAKKKNMTEI